MKKGKIFNVVLSFLFVFSLVFTSCEVGMGKAVDLDAPVLTVKQMVSGGATPKTSFDTTIYCKKSVVFSGEAEDNEAVSNVYAEVKYLGEETYNFLSNATLNGNKWSLSVDFPQEGPCWLKITAEDKSNNYSVKSSKVITLFVDDDAPVGNAWYIDRLIRGIHYELKGLDELKAIVAADPELRQPINKDVAQNVEFVICSSFSDASGIQNVSISIWDENGTNIISSVANEAASSYAPRFRITNSQLSSLGNGPHYLQVRYSAEDVVTDPAANAVTDEEFPMGWFLWWPESDNPKFTIQGKELENENGNEVLKIHVGDSIGVNVFDDDELKDNIVCTLTGDSTVTGTYSVQREEDNVTVSLTAPSKPQIMTLNIQAKATSGTNLNKNVTVYVSDESLPNLIISSPKNNQIPTVTGSDAKINFKGLTLDKSGAAYLEFVWVPDSKTTTNKNAVATALLNSIDHDECKPTGTDKVKCKTIDGMKVWSAALKYEKEEGGTYAEHSFDFDLKLLEDFVIGSTNENKKEKYFLIRLSRADGVYVDTEFKLSKDDLKPELKLDNPLGNMALIDPQEALTIKFHAEKDSQIPMNTSKYKVTYVPKTGNPTVLTGVMGTGEDAGKYVVNSIPASTLTGYAANNENPKYTFYAEDLLGNSKEETYQFVLSTLPTISSVTTTASSKCKLGDTIYISVLFTKSITCNNGTKLKLKGIKNESTIHDGSTIGVDDVVYAEYYGGSGSTSITFKYTVLEGDLSDKLEVYNESDKGPIEGMNSANAHLDVLEDDNNLQANYTIEIDGKSPKVDTIAITTDAVAGNTHGGITYLRAGRKITAKVKVTEAVTVQGAPKFVLKNGSNTLKLICQGTEDNGKTLVFSAKVESGTINGVYNYDASQCIEDIDKIKDSFGNSLLNEKTGVEDPKITVDTILPVKPTIVPASTPAAGSANKYKDNFKFTINGATGAKTEYSTDGGSEWYDYSSQVTLTADADIVARSTDYAGNVSPYSDVTSVEVNKTFPAFTLECTKADGNYKAGTSLEFLVTFESPVNISPTSNAYIKISGSGANDQTDSNTKAEIDSNYKGLTGQSQVRFTYNTRDPDVFTLKVAKGDVYLDGITDLFGITQGSQKLENDYSRPNIKCDGVAPKVKEIVIGGSKENNVYDNAGARTITLTFTENVQLGSGKIYLRQVAGWAIPPVLTANEFTTICNAFPNGWTYGTTGKSGKEILSLQDNGLDMEDSEWGGASASGPINTGYHGTGQYVGPYKKSTQGVLTDGTPDVSTKYVLDFDIDIWETDTTHYYDKTFSNNNYSAPATNARTANDIRAVLEKVHFHERYLSVNATTIDSNDKTKVTFTLPEGLLGDEDLPYGRKWELVIEKGAYMDETGNKFGAEADGSIKWVDAIQTATGNDSSQTDATANGTWGRGRTSVPADETPVVLIKNNTYEYFWSDKVAVPVIRVDRYSYGSGIFQSDAQGNKTGQIANGGTTKPTAYVRVRIDCETEGATVTYNSDGKTATLTSNTGTPYTNAGANSYSKAPESVYTSLSASGTGKKEVVLSRTNGTMNKIIFALGSGDYTKSYIGYVKAVSSLANHTPNGATEFASEGVFQTVVHMVKPTNNGGTTACADRNSKIFSIRGTTGFSGEPYIAPFPLRDNQINSPFVRHTYRESSDPNKTDSKDYYWVSYEVLVMSSFSGYGAKNNNNNPSEWMLNWGKMEPGCFIRCTGLKAWQ